MMFYHGGHIGDVLYSLYTIKKAGGGYLVLGPGQQTMWGVDQINALLPLCQYQDYIEGACQLSPILEFNVNGPDHDFTDVHNIHNPEDFFEWDGRVWPGNCHLKKRYFNGYFKDVHSLAEQMTNYNEEKWIDAPDISSQYDIVFHAPHRKLMRPHFDWWSILYALSRSHKILLIGGDDINEWPDHEYYTKLEPTNLLVVASYIKAATAFLGLPSCNYVIAEGLDKFRFVDMAPQTEGSEPANQRGWDITRWDSERIVRSVEMIFDS